MYQEFEVQEGDFRLVIRKGDIWEEPFRQRKRLSGMTAGKSRRTGARRCLSRTGTIIRSPLVGIFHASVKDGEEPLVTVGTKVEQGQVMGAIEAMKMMNDVAAACDGVVSEILVRDGDLVEYAQPLFVIEG